MLLKAITKLYHTLTMQQLIVTTFPSDMLRVLCVKFQGLEFKFQPVNVLS